MGEDYVIPKLGRLTDVNGNDIGFQISSNGGSINLASGYTNTNGFYVAIAGDAGLLEVKLFNNAEYIVLPFFSGWNPVFVQEVTSYTGNTATNVYWGQ